MLPTYTLRGLKPHQANAEKCGFYCHGLNPKWARKSGYAAHRFIFFLFIANECLLFFPCCVHHFLFFVCPFLFCELIIYIIIFLSLSGLAAAGVASV
jgi:hypothetical protein